MQREREMLSRKKSICSCALLQFHYAPVQPSTKTFANGNLKTVAHGAFHLALHSNFAMYTYVGYAQLNSMPNTKIQRTRARSRTQPEQQMINMPRPCLWCFGVSIFVFVSPRFGLSVATWTAAAISGRRWHRSVHWMLSWGEARTNPAARRDDERSMNLCILRGCFLLLFFCVLIL